MNDLKLCKVCGNEPVRWISRYGDASMNSAEKTYSVRCIECGRRTQEHYSPESAKLEWNEMNGETDIKDSGERTEFETGAVRDMHGGKGRMDLLPWRAIIEVSQHCEQGALKYGEHNVDKGIPIHSLIDSGMRHLAKYMIGMDDEPHLRAAAWNLLWALETLQTHPELQDLPGWTGKGEELRRDYAEV